MTLLLKQAVLKLVCLRLCYGVVGIKGSFEDLGASYLLIIRLKLICNQSDMKLTLKVGGVLARRDIIDSSVIGVKGLVAPMVLSPFALKKFYQASHLVLQLSIFNISLFYINILTMTGAKNTEEILSIPLAMFLHGVTVGRHDLASSMDIPKQHINNQDIFRTTSHVFKLARKKNLKCCLGGGISKDSFVFILLLFKMGLLDKVLTRYVMFLPSVLLKYYDKALSLAQEFLVDLLLSRSLRHYSTYSINLKRIKMLNDRISSNKC